LPDAGGPDPRGAHCPRARPDLSGAFRLSQLGDGVLSGLVPAPGQVGVERLVDVLDLFLGERPAQRDVRVLAVVAAAHDEVEVMNPLVPLFVECLGIAESLADLAHLGEEDGGPEPGHERPLEEGGRRSVVLSRLGCLRPSRR
jgi:hypothetical protein